MHEKVIKVERTLGVAEAKRRFSTLIDRIDRGESFLVSRRGKPVLMLVRPGEGRRRRSRPIGLAAVAGALADWEELAEVVREISLGRRRARDRAAPHLS